tara:strand:- start:113 stop:1291 length:1179 start_codon:yes stop_codon:yes gene_type:complete
MLDNIQAHIIAPQENLDLPIFKLIQMGNSLLSGEIYDVEEKLDGQNITFTVINGQLQFFNKGLTSRRLAKAISGEQPGIKLCDMNKYKQKDLRDTFELAYNEINKIFQVNVGLVEKVFKNGRFVIESSIMGNKNKNTISYDKTYLRLIQYVSMFGDKHDYSNFSNLNNKLSASKKIDIGNVPLLNYTKNQHVYNFSRDILNITKLHGLTYSSTIGDLAQELTQAYLRKHTNIPIGIELDAARRLSRGNKSALSYRSFSSKADWKKFQELEERNTFVQAAIAPLEEIIQRLAFDVFNSYEFEISDNVHASADRVKADIVQIINAANNNNINADDKTKLRINDTIKRLNQLDLYVKDVEGIVFEYEEQKYKLTGLFTPINKLLGYFHYGGAQIE